MERIAALPTRLARALAIACSTLTISAAAEPEKDEGDVRSHGLLTFCFGKVLAGCLTPIDPERIRSSTGRWLGSSAAVQVSKMWDTKSPKLLLIRPELGFQWSFKRGGGEEYGAVNSMIATDRLLFGAMFAKGDRYQQLTTSEVRDLGPVGTTFMGGGTQLFTLPVAHAQLGGPDLTGTGRAQSSFLGVGLMAGFQKMIVPDVVYTLSRGDFNREVQLRLVQQRPIREADIEERLFGFAPALYSYLDLGPIVFETAGDVVYHKGGELRAATARAAQDVRLGIARPFFEIGASARGQVALLPRSPVIFLPSIGGYFAMRSVREGELLNRGSGAVAFFAGPGALRLFVERGWSGSSLERDALWGGGLAISPLRLFDFVQLFQDEGDFLDEVPLQSLIRLLQVVDITLVVGANQKSGATFTGTSGVMSKF